MAPGSRFHRRRVGSPAVIARMRDFSARHGIKPVIETFSFDKINDVVERLLKG
jgi:uncharacterized zinc-type alcohol dehydrogenase-like protein